MKLIFIDSLSPTTVYSEISLNGKRNIVISIDTHISPPRLSLPQ